jgi:hypothetical protein
MKLNVQSWRRSLCWLLLVALLGSCRRRRRSTSPGRMGPIEEFVDEQAVTRLPHTCPITMPSRPGWNRSRRKARVRQGGSAQLVRADLDLAVDEPGDGRSPGLDPAERHMSGNRDDAVGRYVDSMKSTVAAPPRERPKAQFDYAERTLAACRSSSAGAQTQENLEQQRSKVKAGGLPQDLLIHAPCGRSRPLPTCCRPWSSHQPQTAQRVGAQQQAEAGTWNSLLNRNRGTSARWTGSYYTAVTNDDSWAPARCWAPPDDLEVEPTC